MRDFKNMKRQRGRNRGPNTGGQGKPQPHNINRAFESNGPEGIKVRGHAQSVYEKYQQLARDSFSSGDRVLAENYLQHAEHYFRVLRALQPNRPPAEIVGRDVFTNGYELDFEDEALDEPPVAEPETAEAPEGEPRQTEYRRDDRPRDERPREEFRRDEGQGRARQDDGRQGEPRRDRERFDRDRDRNRPRDGERQADRFERPRDGDRPREGERTQGERYDRPRDGDRPQGERRDRFDRDRDRDRDREPRPAAAEVIIPTPETEREPAAASDATVVYPTIDEGSATLRSENGDFSPAPAFLQGAPSVAESEEAEPRRPRPRRRRTRADAADAESGVAAEPAPAVEDA